MLTIPDNAKLLVIVAHPDDELLRMGGTLHRLIDEKQAHVRVVILGEGITSRQQARAPEDCSRELERHRENIAVARQILGYQELSLHQLPDNRFDSLDLLDVVKIVEKEIADFQPKIVITHHCGDLNIDHRITFQAVLTSLRPQGSMAAVSLLTAETPSSTEWSHNSGKQPFVPNLYIPIRPEDLDAKIRAMECYEFERRPSPHPRSAEMLRALAQWRGACCGQPLAEAFCVVRGACC